MTSYASTSPTPGTTKKAASSSPAPKASPASVFPAEKQTLNPSAGKTSKICNPVLSPAPSPTTLNPAAQSNERSLTTPPSTAATANRTTKKSVPILRGGFERMNITKICYNIIILSFHWNKNAKCFILTFYA